MSQDGQCPPEGPSEDQAFVVVSFAMPRGSVFDWHTHPDHQLAWSPSGVLTVRTESTAWVLPPSRALWIPAGIRHETLSTTSATMQTAYVRPHLCSIDWSECTPVAASALLAALIDRLADPVLTPEARNNSEAVLVDLLEPVSMASVEVTTPTEERAREVATALRQCPSDSRSLREWGRYVGASERTLARAFLSDTGLSFGRWRTQLRVSAALPALAAGVSVSAVSRSVGYESPSAFVAAFRRETGLTPGAYFGSPT